MMGALRILDYALYVCEASASGRIKKRNLLMLSEICMIMTSVRGGGIKGGVGVTV